MTVKAWPLQFLGRRDAEQSRRRLTAAVLALTTVWSAPGLAFASPPPEWLSCPDVGEIELRSAPDRRMETVREIAPSAGSNVSADLSAQARLSMLSYEMYDAFTRGEDPRTLNPGGLRTVGLIYGDPGRHTERPGERELRDTETFYGFVADDEATGRRYVVLRGTLQPNEWLRNLQARQAPYPLGVRRLQATAWAHRGFLEIFGSLTLDGANGRTPLASALPGLVADRDVFIIGHSLGGALATLVGVDAARLAPEDAARIQVTTFGSPRVGDAGFAEMAKSLGRLVRVCNLSDAVTAVPPNAGRARYTHVGDVFQVSSFDWPRLDNDLERGQQILCWHSIYSYTYMTDPGKTEFAELEACLAQP